MALRKTEGRGMLQIALCGVVFVKEDVDLSLRQTME
jgi:hypothetical protein